MNAESVSTEIPTALKRLIRLVMRGFYSAEHALVMDALIRNPCVKEEDLIDLLKFEVKQLRTVMTQLKNDRFVKIKLKIETDVDGRTNRKSYYYISYKPFVNITKYKLDHMRRKIEEEERNSTSRSSFKCTGCDKTFSDLVADQLCDLMTGEFHCSYCNAPVEEDESAVPKADCRLLLATFNEQIKPLYNLLQEIEKVRLAPELLEPEPRDLADTIKIDANQHRNKQHPVDNSRWSGDTTRNKNYFLGSNQNVTINFNEDTTASEFLQKKEQPSWMIQSTVKFDKDICENLQHAPESLSISGTDVIYPPEQSQDNIMEVLLAHEGKTGEPAPFVPGHNSDAAATSYLDDSLNVFAQSNETNVEEMEDDNEAFMVQVGEEKIPLSEVREHHTAKMTVSEKETYIKLTQDLYASMYE